MVKRIGTDVKVSGLTAAQVCGGNPVVAPYGTVKFTTRKPLDLIVRKTEGQVMPGPPSLR